MVGYDSLTRSKRRQIYLDGCLVGLQRGKEKKTTLISQGVAVDLAEPEPGPKPEPEPAAGTAAGQQRGRQREQVAQGAEEASPRLRLHPVRPGRPAGAAGRQAAVHHQVRQAGFDNATNLGIARCTLTLGGDTSGS